MNITTEHLNWGGLMNPLSARIINGHLVVDMPACSMGVMSGWPGE